MTSTTWLPGEPNSGLVFKCMDKYFLLLHYEYEFFLRISWSSEHVFHRTRSKWDVQTSLACKQVNALRGVYNLELIDSVNRPLIPDNVHLLVHYPLLKPGGVCVKTFAWTLGTWKDFLLVLMLIWTLTACKDDAQSLVIKSHVINTGAIRVHGDTLDFF